MNARVFMIMGALAVALPATAAVVVRTAVAYRPHPVARGAAVGATAVAVGSAVRTLPPSCRAVRVGNMAYQQCGTIWYQPRYAGSDVTYIVVAPPH
jgi:hypothetical protein